MDHVDLLGGTLASIASHKGGIFKAGTGVALAAPGIVASARAALGAAAAAAGLTLVDAEPLRWAAAAAAAPGVAEQPSTGLALPLPLAGGFQLQNAALALAALQALRPRWPALDDGALTRGFAAARWRGRWERLAPTVAGAPLPLVADGGHNDAALAAVRADLDAHAPAGATLVYACTASRPLRENLAALLRAGDALVAVPFSPPAGMPWVRAHATADVVAAAASLPHAGARACDSLAAALAEAAAERAAALARGDAPRPLVVCGSLYLVADLFREFIPAEDGEAADEDRDGGADGGGNDGGDDGGGDDGGDDDAWRKPAVAAAH
jgi:folylpolyglutamate synthase/dihydropteroate synthase